MDQQEEEPEKDAADLDEAATKADISRSRELVLPGGLSLTQQESIQMALQSLLDRDETLLVPQRRKDEAPSRPTGAVMIERGDVSVATASTAFGAGRNALNELLSQVRQDSKVVQASPTSLSTGDLFLGTSGTNTFVNEVDAQQVEGIGGGLLSDLSSDDELSVAASRVGQKAIQKLLSLAGRGAQKKGAKSGRKPAGKRKALSSAEGPKRSDHDGRSLEGDDYSEPSSADQGKRALDVLLEEAGMHFEV
jgi:hypothetical protein